MFKGGQTARVFAGVYMTGILPIKKYNTQSALNNFIEYSMVSPRNMAGFFGFTKAEVKTLAEKYDMDFDELEKWYDGYQIGKEPSIFNPNSVMQALNHHECSYYWTSGGLSDYISVFISINIEGLRDDINSLLNGKRIKINPFYFKNDITSINSKDDVFTILINFGYLSYDRDSDECFIPNLEARLEVEKLLKDTEFHDC